MLIAGSWLLDNAGTEIPALMASVLGHADTRVEEWFLVDCGADRTVLSNSLLSKLGLPHSLPPSGIALSGIGGKSNCVIVETRLEFRRQDGVPIRFSGRFTAF